MIMKRILLFTLSMLFMAVSFGQVPYAKKANPGAELPKEKAITETNNFSKTNKVMPTARFKSTTEEAEMGITWYDLQSNSSMQNRIHWFSDGTIGGVYTFGDTPTGFSERGTGYNYHDGNSWGPNSTERIEADRTGWPAYGPLGENGELVVSHYSGAAVDGLAMSYRTEKGTGDWQYLPDYMGPDGHALLWPRMATGGVDNSVIHVLPITTPTGNGGTVYEGVNGALVYSRSTDGGQTWDPENVLLDEINSDYYLYMGGDTYEIQARGDVVAFVFGDGFQDLVMMKSTDGGDTWTKTVIYETPFPLWDPNAQFETEIFYCADGAHALAIDANGMVHVAFGINYTYSDGAGTFWNWTVDGIGYWNETRPVFSNSFTALSPIPEWEDSELERDYSLVAWSQDLDGDDTATFFEDAGLYYLGASSMPSIHVDDQGRVFLVYSSITETFNNGAQNFRHIWARTANNYGEFWGDFVDLTGDLIHIFDECVFPSISQTSDDYIYINYQYDEEPGLHVRGDEDDPTENTYSFMKISKDELISGVADKPAILEVDVAQNQPNPFSTTSTVYINLREASDLSMEVTNMMGQVVYRVDAGHATAGLNKLTIDGSQLSNGVYFYTVRAGEAEVTKKMIVE